MMYSAFTPLFILPVVAVLAVVVFAVCEFNAAKRMRYFRSLVDMCQDLHGFQFTLNTLQQCLKKRIGVRRMISIFERYCQTSNNLKHK